MYALPGPPLGFAKVNHCVVLMKTRLQAIELTSTESEKLLKVFRKSKITFPLKDLSVHLYILELEKGLKNVQNLMYLYKVVTQWQGDKNALRVILCR